MNRGIFDATGKPVEFYDITIDVGDLPYGVVEISDEDWLAYINDLEKWRRNPATGLREEVPPVVKTPADLKIAEKTAAAKLRYDKEIGGITVGGSIISTDRESQALITGAWVRVQQDPTLLIDFKAKSGWVQINKATVESMAAAVGAHVQACFTAEKNHCDAIDALPDDVTAIEGYDITTGWPI